MFDLSVSWEHNWGCLFDMWRKRFLVLLPFKYCIFFMQMRHRAAAKLSKRSKCLQINFRSLPRGRRSPAFSWLISSTGTPCLIFSSCADEPSVTLEPSDEWGCWVRRSCGCFLDKCRIRLLVPPLLCSFLEQMRQCTAAKPSNRVKCLQIQLRLRLLFWLSSVGASCPASWISFMEELTSPSSTVTTQSESTSSTIALEKKKMQEKFHLQINWINQCDNCIVSATNTIIIKIIRRCQKA